MRSWLRTLPALACLAACSTDPTVIARRELQFGQDAETPEDIPDAALEAEADVDGEEAGEPDADPTRELCTTSEECGKGRYCSRRRCEDAQGECASRDTVCPTAQDPVCGCDGISYFNDCLRRQNGVTAYTLGECSETEARTCGLADPAPCPEGAFCGRLSSEPDPSLMICEVDLLWVRGRCWVTPACDPQARGGEEYIPCVPAVSLAGGTPGGGGGPGTPGGSFGGTGGGGTGGNSGSGAPVCVNACDAIRSETLHIRSNACWR